MPAIPSYQQKTRVSGAGLGGRTDALETAQIVGRGIEEVADSVARVQHQEAVSQASDALSKLRLQSTQRFIDAQDQAADDAANFTPNVLGQFDKDLADLSSATASQKARKILQEQAKEIRTDLGQRALSFEAGRRRAYRTETSEAAADRLRATLELDPDQFAAALGEQLAAVHSLDIPPEQKAALVRLTSESAKEGAASGIAKKNPALALANLTTMQSGDLRFDALSAEARHRIEQQAKVALVDQQTASIMSAFRRSTAAGNAAMSVFEKAPIAPDLQADIRAHVGQEVSQLRAERRQENVASITDLERAIATDTAGDKERAAAQSLYDVGAFGPEELASTLGQIDAGAVRRAKAGAGAAEISNALAQGLPLDPKDPDQRKALDAYFTAGTQGTVKGSDSWRSTAIAIANKTRMLPDSALAWTRQAMRSPNAELASNAAQFYGAVAASTPDAVSGFDEDTKAFAGTVNSMIEAGTNPKAAVETARANVFDLKPELREQRRQQYRKETRDSTSALDSFIDRDFDPGILTSQPAASASLLADFDAQAGRYYEKVGDVKLARELAWTDLKRVYGPTKVNGDPMLVAFPPERFGVKPEEVRAEIGDFLKNNPQADNSTAADIIVVPDALTLRLAGDLQTGGAIRPSYKLVTKTGDLMLDKLGQPVRWTIPGSEEITRRIQKAQADADAKAREQIEAARAERARRQEAEARAQDRVAARFGILR